MWKGSRVRWLAIAALMMLVSWLTVAGQTRPAQKSQVQKRFAMAVDQTFQRGVLAKLPPHISTLLGLTDEQECPVRQGVERSGAMVRGIDVSAADQNDVVLFVVDETANDQVLYLTSAEGKLRRVVSVKKGAGRVSRITDQHRKAFAKEKQFWVERLVLGGGAKVPPK
jgi:hypothetical protein